MIVLEICGEWRGCGSGSAVHQHDQSAARHAHVVRVLHGVEHERGPPLRPQRFGIRRGQESGGEESIAQPDARGVFAFPEWRRITGCLGLFLTLVEQLDEVSQQLPVLPVCLASRVPAPACSTALMAASSCAVIRLSARSFIASSQALSQSFERSMCRESTADSQRLGKPRAMNSGILMMPTGPVREAGFRSGKRCQPGI